MTLIKERPTGPINWLLGIPYRTFERLDDPSKRLPNGPENAAGALAAIFGGATGAGRATGIARAPATTAESVASKLETYLLKPDHPKGGPKAEWFRSALGFTRENSGELAKQLVFDESKAIQTRAPSV